MKMPRQREMQTLQKIEHFSDENAQRERERERVSDANITRDDTFYYFRDEHAQ